MVANYQLFEEKKEKKILRKPKLYVRDNKLGDICFDFERHQLSLDGDLNGVMFREEVFESNLDDTLRNISLDLVNASSMNIYEVDYEWEIVVNQFKSNNLAQELVQTTSEKNRYNFKKKDPIDGNRVRSSNEVFYVTEIKNNNETIIIGNGTLALSGNISIDESYIKPHESIEIYLPSAFLRLIENKIVTINKLRTPEDFNLPTLNLRINFLNYEMKKLSILFKVSVKSTRQVTHRLESDVDVKVHNIEFFVIKEENPQLD